MKKIHTETVEIDASLFKSLEHWEYWLISELRLSVKEAENAYRITMNIEGIEIEEG